MMLNNYFFEHIVGSNDTVLLNSSYIKVYLHVQFGIAFWVYYLLLAPENTIGACTIKIFTAVIFVALYYGTVLADVSHMQPSLIFWDKSVSQESCNGL